MTCAVCPLPIHRKGSEDVGSTCTRWVVGPVDFVCPWIIMAISSGVRVISLLGSGPSGSALTMMGMGLPLICPSYVEHVMSGGESFGCHSGPNLLHGSLSLIPLQ